MKPSITLDEVRNQAREAIDEKIARQNVGVEVPLALLGVLTEVTADLGQRDHAAALKAKALRLVEDARITEGIALYESALDRYPDDLSLQGEFNSFLHGVMASLDRLSTLRPADGEIPAAYHRLLGIGVVPMAVHLALARYYRLTGEIEKACDLVIRIHRVAPGFFGLPELIEKLSQETSDARIGKLNKNRMRLAV